MNARSYRRPLAPRRGTILPQALIFGVVVGLGIAALTVDVGLLTSMRSQLQRTVDSAALAGASGVLELESESRAQEYATKNEVSHESISAANLDVETGMWSGVTRTFTPTPHDGINGKLPNSVRVTGTRDGLGVYFARFLGINETEATRPATALVGSGRCVGIWGIEVVTVDGNIVTDSFDSADGGYGPGNIHPNGDVCSCGNIIANGSISIRGDAMYGEGFDFIPFGNAYEVLGLVDDHSCDFPNPEVDYAAAAADNDNDLIPLTDRDRDPFQGSPYNLYVTGNDHLTLPPGTFYFDSVMIDGQGYIEVTGPTTMYINGNAILTGGGLVNTTEVAGNLVIYAQGPEVNLSGNATFYGAVVAPDATVTAEGTFDSFGVVLARVLDFDGDTNFHVDEQLAIDLFGGEVVRPVLVE